MMIAIIGLRLQWALGPAPQVFVCAPEFLHLALCFILGDPITLLNSANQLLAIALQDCHIVIGELAPLFLHFSLELFPVSFNAIIVHGWLLRVDYKACNCKPDAGGMVPTCILLMPRHMPEDELIVRELGADKIGFPTGDIVQSRWVGEEMQIGKGRYD